MNREELNFIADKLVAPGKGILAADESSGTIEKRFAEINIESTEDNRRAYRELLFTTPDIEKYISGVILYDETVWQKASSGINLPEILSQKGIVPGIKVDEGKESVPESPDEDLTKGLEGLPARLPKYKDAGMLFAKWRAVYNISDLLPTESVSRENARRLAEYAYLCQENGIVPIVEPEVLMDGNHTIERCKEVSTQTLTHVFSELERRGVYLGGMLLKPNMIVPGKDSGQKVSASDVARETLMVLQKCVPHEVPGIVFLSGGLSPEDSTLYLNEMNKTHDLPWQLSFSYGRALQKPPLLTWVGKTENVLEAQSAFLKRARLNSLARSGEYTSQMEE